MISKEEILSLFQQINREKKEIKLINVYKGFPISYPGAVIAVGKKAIKVKTEAFQTVCLYLDKETYVQSDMFPAVIRANVANLDFNKLEATLSTFKYMVGGVGNRTQVRVEPKEPMEGLIKSKQRHTVVRGELADISLDGLAVYLEPQLFTPRLYYKGAEIIIHIKLPGVKKPPAPRVIEETMPSRPEAQPRFDNLRRAPTRLPMAEYPPIYTGDTPRRGEFIILGTIVNLREESLYNRMRLGIRLNAEGSSRSLISEFILQRQTEILREIRSLYSALSRFEDKK